MNRRTVSFALLIATAIVSFAFAQDAKVEEATDKIVPPGFVKEVEREREATAPELGIPAEVIPVGQYAQLKPKTEAKAITYIGMSGVEPFPSDMLKDARWFVLDTRGLQPGRYLFQAVGSLNDIHTRVAFSVVIGNDPNPIPQPGPTPGPGPIDPPKPPDVDPLDPDGVEQSVIGGEGFRTMVVWEDEDRAKLPREMLNTIIGVPFAKYITEHAAKDATGRADWWLLDDDYTDEQISRLPDYWREPYKAAVVKFRRDNRPAILLSNSAKKTKPKAILTFVPKTQVDIMKLAKRYAEN